jgi:hypothetical protein
MMGCTDEEPRKAAGLTGPSGAARLTRRRAAGLVLGARLAGSVSAFMRSTAD